MDAPQKEDDDDDVTEPESDSCQGDKPTGDTPPCDVNTSGDVSDNDTSPKSPSSDVIEKEKTDDDDRVPPVIVPESDVKVPEPDVIVPGHDVIVPVPECPVINDVSSQDVARAAKDKAMAGLGRC